MTTLAITATLNYHLPQSADVLLAVEAIPMADQHLLTDLLKVKGDCSPLTTIEGMDGLGRRTWLHAEGRIDIIYTATVAIDRAPTELLGPFRAFVKKALRRHARESRGAGGTTPAPVAGGARRPADAAGWGREHRPGAARGLWRTRLPRRVAPAGFRRRARGDACDAAPGSRRAGSNRGFGLTARSPDR